MRDALEIETEKQRRLDLLNQARAIIDSAVQDMHRLLNSRDWSGLAAAADGIEALEGYCEAVKIFDAMEDDCRKVLADAFEEWTSEIKNHFNSMAEAAADA